MSNRHDCANYSGGFCNANKPGTLCEIKGCVAFFPKGIKLHPGKPPMPDTNGNRGELTWQDIMDIVLIADRMLTGDVQKDTKRFPNGQAYYEAVLKEWREGK